MARPGDTVLVARISHLPVIAGPTLAGLRPVFLGLDHDAEWLARLLALLLSSLPAAHRMGLARPVRLADA